MEKKSKMGLGTKITITILSIILVINLFILLQSKMRPYSIPSLFGYKPFIVLSESMEHEMYVGDLIFVKEVDSKSLKVGDVIAFRGNDDLVTTHRIYEMVKSDKGICYRTKGDNNNRVDSEVICPQSLEGRYVFKIPRIGKLILFIQEPLGFFLMMGVLVVICVFIYLTYTRTKISKEDLEAFEEFKKQQENSSEKS